MNALARACFDRLTANRAWPHIDDRSRCACAAVSVRAARPGRRAVNGGRHIGLESIHDPKNNALATGAKQERRWAT